MKESTISLIIPAYNEEKYIEACLDHAIKNSHRKLLEIIVIDNASTDRTGEIARKYKNVKVIYEGRKGVMHARQRGFKESSGDLIAFVDADSHIPKGWYDAIVKEFKNENLVCLSGRNLYYDMSKRHNFLIFIFWSLAKATHYFLGYMAVFNNLVIRRDTLIKMGGLDTSIEFYGDDTNTARRAHAFGKSKFKFNFIMPTSGRRLTEGGLIKLGRIYTINFISEAIFHKPHTKGYQEIR